MIIKGEQPDRELRVGSKYGLLKEKKSKEVKTKQKVIWKDKHRMC